MNSQIPTVYEAELGRIARDLAATRDWRAREVIAARDEGGYTWRRIGNALGMTELGAKKVYLRAKEEA